MVYLCQLDYPDIPYPTHTSEPDNERGPHTTVKSSGCGLCSAVMMADRLLPFPHFTLEDALKLAMDSGANAWSGTSYRVLAPVLAERLGLEYEVTSDLDRLAEALKTGACAVAHVRKRPDGSPATFTNGGHYITVIGVEEERRFAILDPSYKEGKFDTPERAGKVEVVKDVLCLCCPEVLAEDIAPLGDRGLYIFRRPAAK